MISKSFLKSSFVYTFGGALPMAASIILLKFYADYLTLKQYAALSCFYIGISILCQILFSFSVETYFGVKYTQLTDHPQEQKKFVATVSRLSLLIGVAISIFAFVAGPLIFSLVFSPEDEVYFWPFGIASIITGFFNAYFRTGTNALIYFKKPGQFLLFNFINFAATIAISLWGLFYFPNTLYGPISGRFFSGLIIFFLALYIFKQHSQGKAETKFLPDLVKFCAPYFLYVICSWILGNIDRYFLKTHVSSETLAAYDLLLKCYFGIEFMQNALSAIIFPRLFEVWSKHKKLETTPESNRYFNVFTALNIIMLAGFCVVIPMVIKLFIRTQEYYTSFDYIGLIAGGYATRSILNFYLSTILYSKKNWQLVKIFGVTSAFQLVVTYFLVRSYGLTGALYAGIATKVVQVICSAIFTKGIFTYRFNAIKIYVLPLLYLATNIVLYIVYPQYNFTAYLFQLIGFSLIFFLVFRNEIKIVLKQYIS